MDTRLKSKSHIDKLFIEGKSIFVFPIKVVYAINDNLTDDMSFKFGVSVSKRSFKKAVDRNKIKRRIREAMRLNLTNNMICSGQSIMVIYVGKEIFDFSFIQKATRTILYKKMVWKQN